jgi:ABC-type nickel/cobalt efflux system permease component RcnA
MFLAIFAITLLAIILVVGFLLVWREWRASDYTDHLDPRDEPSREQANASATAHSTSTHRAGGSVF